MSRVDHGLTPLTTSLSSLVDAGRPPCQRALTYTHRLHRSYDTPFASWTARVPTAPGGPTYRGFLKLFPVVLPKGPSLHSWSRDDVLRGSREDPRVRSPRSWRVSEASRRSPTDRAQTAVCNHVRRTPPSLLAKGKKDSKTHNAGDASKLFL